ncbi:peptide-methionine (S)-S-oxide reductase MsrA [Rhodopila sp.]|uniref:peptide-methionine (S)-S-oxide reductase MsrA n=1 Tax=Rhodopila sp. TaxID=2480087 RepID=UPI003D099550
MLKVLAAGPLGLMLSMGLAQAADAPHALPAPVVDAPAVHTPGEQTAVFSGGCFWGVQGVFEHVKGVTRAVSGYAGGHVVNPDYEQVSSGDTGHAESVRVTFDPAQVSYGTLLRIFFSVALDPTQKDRQGPDWGTQYRSELFVDGPEQKRIATAYVAQLDAAHTFGRPIATRIDPAGPFYPAEAYHQDYLDLHPDAAYIVINDLPKVQALRTLFPEWWQPAPVKVGKLASGD